MYIVRCFLVISFKPHFDSWNSPETRHKSFFFQAPGQSDPDSARVRIPSRHHGVPQFEKNLQMGSKEAGKGLSLGIPYTTYTLWLFK